MFKNLPLTKIRIILAGILSRVVRIFYSDKQTVKRNNLTYELDLTEGIDFSVFLFGNFQKYIFGKDLIKLSQNAVIIDVGANIGNMCMQFAALPECGKVYAFEPTDYAYPKLLKNIDLNPEIKPKISVIKSFVSDTVSENSDIKAYASWKIGKKNDTEETHPVHLGSISQAKETPSISLDNFIVQNNIQRLDLLKIDTDGHELKVLKGSISVIKKFRPYIIFEVGLYILKENKIEFTEFFDLFEGYSCKFIDMKSKKVVNVQNYKEIIPENSTTDILVVPE